MKDAQVTVKKVVLDGSVKVKIIVEILKPYPESARFFVYSEEHKPQDVTLNGHENITSSYFENEQQGLEWADSMLNAVIKLSNEQRVKAMAIDERTIGISLKYHRATYLPSLLSSPSASRPSCFLPFPCAVHSPTCDLMCRYQEECRDSVECAQ